MEKLQPNHVCRIALVGGPGAGKTTALSYLYDKLSSLGFRVYIIPEVARLVFSSGVSHSDFSQAEVSLQTALLMGQIYLETIYDRLVGECKNEQKTILIYDRGRMDVKAFTSAHIWEQILHEQNLTEVDLRDRPYDAVIHMVTAANGAANAYVTDDVRKETPEQATDLDHKVLNAWIGHPHVTVIANQKDGLDGKLRRTLNAVLKAVGHPIPIEIERKYLIDDIDWNKMPKSEVVAIEQRYLRQGDRRIRKRGQNGRYVYTLTEKQPISGTIERMEVERQISVQEYNQLLAFCDNMRYFIRKDRHCFVWEGQYFELDVFHGRLEGLRLLEVELSSERQPVYLPPFIKIEREVTNESEYGNAALACVEQYKVTTSR